jgi:6-phosphogluconolactonase
MRGEVAPEQAAKEYESAVLKVFQTPVPSFDLILLGIGYDGHTASLFPGSEALQENHRLVVANWEPSLQVHRITFTLALINAARVVAFLDTDESKAEVLRRVLEPAPGEGVLPATMVRPIHGTVHWFLTKEAASLLKTTDA